MLISGLKTILSGHNVMRVLEGLGTTVSISLIAIFFGTILGLILGSIWTASSKWLNPLFKIYLEIFRIVPTIPLLFLFYYILPRNFDFSFSAFQVSTLVFSLWFSAELSDIVRGAIKSVPKNQVESGYVIGLSGIQMYYYVLIPQALKNILPAFINLSTRIIKTTSILLLISVTDVVTVGQQIIEANSQNSTIPILMYGVIAILYWIINAALSFVSNMLEKKSI